MLLHPSLRAPEGAASVYVSACADAPSMPSAQADICPLRSPDVNRRLHENACAGQCVVQSDATHPVICGKHISEKAIFCSCSVEGEKALFA